MPNRSELIVLCGIVGVIACGSPSDGNFSDRSGAGGQTSTGGSSSGKGGGAGVVEGSSGKGGSSGSSSGGKGGAGGKGGGASGATGGTTGGTGAETGGTGGGSETGGTTGTGGSTGGSGSETGGAGGMGGSGAMAGTGSETGGTTGGTGDTGGTGGSSAGAGGSGGRSTNPDCVAHARAYDKVLQAARACNADSDKEQCTQPVPGNIECGCSVWVNPQNEEAVAELEHLMKTIPEDCIILCAAILCIEPETANCVARSGGADGTCGPLSAAQ